MANFCGECALYDIKGTPKWGNEHYCNKKGKYYPPTRSACSDFIKNNVKEGYQKAGCYITTIVCNVLGYADDCFILTTLREFRENYLKQNPEYLPLLIEYDQIGPKISENILNEQDVYITALEIARNFLVPCVSAILDKLYDKAIDIYKNMVMYLKLKYQLIRTTVDYKVDTPIENLGKGRLRTLYN